MVSLYSYSLIGKAFEKKNKGNRRSRRKTNKTTEEHGKQLVESNAFFKNEYDSKTD